MRTYTRGENQSLLINNEISITVLAVFPDHVHVGIHSPRSTPDYWETDLYLPYHADAEPVELELTIR